MRAAWAFAAKHDTYRPAEIHGGNPERNRRETGHPEELNLGRPSLREHPEDSPENAQPREDLWRAGLVGMSPRHANSMHARLEGDCNSGRGGRQAPNGFCVAGQETAKDAGCMIHNALPCQPQLTWISVKSHGDRTIPR